MYDPVKAHEYYERTKKLKGRDETKTDIKARASKVVAKPPPSSNARAAAAQRVKALNGKLTQLKAALAAARAKSADKPSAAEQKSKDEAYNKQHYAKNKTKIANDRKAETRASGESSKSNSPSATKSASKGVEEIEAAIRTTLVELKAAIAKLKSL